MGLSIFGKKDISQALVTKKETNMIKSQSKLHNHEKILETLKQYVFNKDKSLSNKSTTNDYSKDEFDLT